MKGKFTKLLPVVLLAITVISAAPARADRAVPGDYDGDGRTDLTVARNINGYWNWFIRYATGAESSPIVFGLSNSSITDSLYAGDPDGNGAFAPGVVRKHPNGFLYWYFQANDGSAAETQWGLNGDTPVTGFFDADAATDLAVVRNINGFSYWFIRGTLGGQILGDQWGLATDTPYSGDITGDGLDDMVVVRNAGGALTWYVHSPLGSVLSPISWGLAGDKTLAPFDVNNDGYDDLVVVRNIGGFLTAFVRLTGANGSNAGEQVINFGLDGDTPFVGSFFGNGQGDFGVYRPGKSSVSTNYINVANTAGIAVGFGLEDDVFVQPEGNAEASSSGSALASVCPSIVGVSKGFLWKPSSDDSGPPRVGKPAILFTSNIPKNSCLAIYAKNGEQVSSAGVYAYSGNYGGRWYTGWGCGDRKSASQIASAASSAAGDTEVYIQRSNNVCVGPINPTARNGSL